MKVVVAVLLLFILSTFAFGADAPCIVPGRGHFYIRTGTAGLFGAFAHDHQIEAQKISGCADLTRSSIKLVFTTADIKVIDPKESESNRIKIQKTMETDVLRVAEFPQIVFESTSIERGTAGEALRVHGNLTIRGKTQPVVIPLTFTSLSDGSYTAKGTYRFKQTTFGIQPIQLGGGTIKVKDELQTEFELFLK
jgi:polyisoprenoid-binding protein YceI